MAGNPVIDAPARPTHDRHHRDAELFDLGYVYEREVGWSMVAPSVAARVAAPV